MSAKEAREKFISTYTEYAKIVLKDHKIISKSNGRWYVKNPKNNAYWFEVISLENGPLYIGGGISHVIFSYYVDLEDHERKLRWIGHHDEVSYYVAQQASIGMTGCNITYDVDTTVAIAELEDLIEACREGDEQNLEAYREALRLLNKYNLHYAKEHLYEELENSSEILPLGEVVSPRIIFAWQAAKKLCQLLDSERTSI